MTKHFLYQTQFETKDTENCLLRKITNTPNP